MWIFSVQNFPILLIALQAYLSHNFFAKLKGHQVFSQMLNSDWTVVFNLAKAYSRIFQFMNVMAYDWRDIFLYMFLWGLKVVGINWNLVHFTIFGLINVVKFKELAARTFNFCWRWKCYEPSWF